MKTDIEILMYAEYNEEEELNETIEDKKTEINNVLKELCRIGETSNVLKNMDFEFTFTDEGSYEYKKLKK